MLALLELFAGAFNFSSEHRRRRVHYLGSSKENIGFRTLSAATPTLQMPQNGQGPLRLRFRAQHLGIIGYTFEENRGHKLIKSSREAGQARATKRR